MPTRFTSLGLAGGSATAGRSDPIQKTYVIPIKAVASAAPQETGFFLPEDKFLYKISGYLHVITPESTGTTKTIIVGTGTAPIAIGLDVSSAGLTGSLTAGPFLPGPETEVLFTLGSDDYAELEAEYILSLELIKRP